MMQAAEYLAGELARQGVKFVFGIPGGPSIPYIEAFNRSGMEFILTSSETAAGVMADVTGRLSGRPGICHATFGPGAVNLASGVGGAFLDRSPVIALTSEVPDSMRDRTCQMNISHQALFQPITKKTFRMDPANGGEVLEEAFRIALSEYPGPVHIGLPSDLAEQEIIEIQRPAEAPPDTSLDFKREEMMELLAGSSRPVLAIGLTARRVGAAAEIMRLLENYPMPVVLTPMAKGLISADHPCYAGVLFHALSSKLTPVLDEADLVISIGYDPVEYNYESWMPRIPLVSINTLSVDMPEGMEVSQVIGNLKEGIELVSGLISGSGSRLFPLAASIREEIQDSLSPMNSDFGPVAVLDILGQELPGDAVVTADVGSHLHVIGQHWNPSNPGQLIMTNGWSSMGFGLPAAIAAQIHSPDKIIFCLTGDGGFLMAMGELVTARRYNLPVKIVVFADRELNLIKLKQSWKGADFAGVGLYEGSLFQEQSILGVKVLKAENTSQFRAAVKQAIDFPGPVVIEAAVYPSDYERLIGSS